MIQHLLRAPDPSLFWTGKSSGTWTLRWLGTAGFTLDHGQHTAVIDPFLTRHGLMETLRQPLRVNEALVRREIPKASACFVGHAHYDHVLEAPFLCGYTGAKLYGSRSTAMVARAAGLPEEQIVECAVNEPFDHVHGTAIPFRSQHGKVYLGRVTLPGKIDAPPNWPPRLKELRHGQVFTWWIDWGGLRVVHVDSADYETALLQGHRADVLCLCAIGRKHRPGYTREIIEALQPKLVVPCHWDYFGRPFSEPARQLPAVNLAGFVREIEECGADVCVLPMGASVGIEV